MSVDAARTRTRQFVLGLLCTAALLVGMGAVVTPTSAAAPGSTGSIEGTLSVAGGGDPTGILAEVYAYDSWDDEWYPFRSAPADETGAYRVPVPDGVYRVEFGRVSGGASPAFREFYDDAASIWQATDVQVGDGAPTTGVDAELATRTGIHGVVTADAYGRAWVRVIDTATDRVVRRTRVRVGPDPTPYSFFGMRAGDYRVDFSRVSGDPYAGQYYDGVPEPEGSGAADVITVAEGSAVGAVNADLTSGNTLSGVIHDQRGDDRYCAVAAYTADGSLAGRSDRQRNRRGFTITGLSAGDYLLKADCYDRPDTLGYYDGDAVMSLTAAEATPITVTEGDNELPEPLVLSGRAGASISGELTVPEGYWAGSIRVRAVRIGKGGRELFDRWDRTNRRGAYDISGLPAGNYRVEFDRVSGYSAFEAQFYNAHPESEGRYAADLVPVGEGEDVALDPTTLELGGTISAVLQSSAGEPLQGCRVYARPVDRRLVTRYGYSRRDGSVVIGGLTGTDYRLTFLRGECRVGGETYYDGDETLSRASEDAAPVTAQPGDDVDLGTLAVEMNPSINGTVVSENGDVYLRNIYVTATRVGAGGRDLRTWRDRTSRRGDYQIADLPAGRYRVEFNRLSGYYSSIEGQIYNGHPDGEGRGSADLVTLGEGETVVLELTTVVTGGAVVAQVLDSNGRSMRYCQVTAVPTAWGPTWRDSYVSRRGDLHLEGLTTASYYLEFRGSRCRGDRRGVYDGDDTLNSDFSQAVPVDIVVGETLDLGTLTLLSRPSIEGTITLPEGAGTYDDRRVVLLNEAGRVRYTTYASRSGRYDFDRVRPGSYRVAFARVSGASVAAQYFDGVYEHAGVEAGDLLTVADGDRLTGIDADLGVGGAIEGVVRNGAGDLLAQCRLVAISADRSTHGDGAGTKAQGRFRLEGLATGDYLVALAQSDSAACGLRGGARHYLGVDGTLVTDVTQAVPVAVTVGETTTLDDLVVTTGGILRGALDFPEGNERRVWLSVVNTETGATAFRRTYAEDRPFSIAGLFPGTYRIDIARDSAPTVFAAGYFSGVPDTEGSAGADLFTVSEGGVTEVGTETVRVGGSLGLRVVDDRGRRERYCGVFAFDPDGVLTPRSRVSGYSYGHYVVTGLSTASYALGVECGQGVHYYDGDETLSGDAEDIELIDTVEGEDFEFANAFVYGAEPSEEIAVVTAPTVAGTPQVGQPLHVEGGEWLPTPESFAYQWFVDDEPVPGAIGATYVPGADDVDGVVSARVTARADGYESVSTTTEPTEPVVAGALVQVAAPVIEGEARVGQDLTATGAAWAPEPDGVAYQWFADGDAIEDATTDTLTLTRSLRGAVITVDATATLAGYADDTQTSAATGAVLPAQSVNEERPVLVGTPKVGEILSVTDGTWNSDDLTFTYQWTADGEPIDGATASTYPVPAAMVGKVLVAEVTASGSDRDPVTVASPPSDPVAQGTFGESVAPTIDGTARVGELLTASPGNWSPAADSVAYQWFADGEPIADATAQTFTPTPAQKGTAITVAATASRAGYEDATLTSTATDPVKPARITGADKPAVTGEAKVGATLSATDGTWNHDDLTFTRQWLADAEPIDGATATTLQVTPDLVGAVITVAVTATGTDRDPVTVVSEPTAPVAEGTFANETAPAITGEARVGRTLTATDGTWQPTPGTVTRQWLADGEPIAGAVGTELTLTAAERGAAITVKVTVARAGYTSASQTSAATAAVKPSQTTNTAKPAITGTAQVGETLAASTGTWNHDDLTFARQWSADGEAIDGATGANLELTADLVGAVITVAVTASGSDRDPVTVTSDPTAAVVKGELVNQTAPTIDGSARVGETLTAAPGTWSPAATGVAYQWMADGEAITGATGATFVPTRAQRGQALAVEVTASRAGYVDDTQVSSGTDPVRPEQSGNTAKPQISGTATVGETLSATAGSWNHDDLEFGFRWLIGDSFVDGATGSEFVVPPGAVGETITVRVTATGSDRHPVTVTSDPTAPVAAGTLVNDELPEITGTARVGQTLQGTDGSWTLEPDAVTRQWLADGEPIVGATGTSYTLTAGERGTVITLAVTATRAGYVDDTQTSAATETVKPANTSGSDLPVISGDVVVGETLTATEGTWNHDDLTFAFQWLVGGEAVDGATTETFDLPADALGEVVAVQVTATGADRDPVTVTSEDTVPVEAGTLALTKKPKLSGKPQAKKKIAVVLKDVSTTPASTVTYQWTLNGKAIKKKAKSATYAIPKSSQGKKLGVVVTFTAPGYADLVVTLDAGKVAKAKSGKGGKKGGKGEAGKGGKGKKG